MTGSGRIWPALRHSASKAAGSPNDYWPQFAQAGKAEVTVRQLLSHQAGLSALDAPVRVADVADPAKLSAVLAAQAPAWKPGTRHGYHAITLG